jgi:hypothetical protein
VGLCRPVLSVTALRNTRSRTPARAALPQGKRTSGDNGHIAKTPCYHRSSPVVCSVPVTGLMVTMPDGSVSGRSRSRMQVLAGLRCSTLRLT